MREKQQRGCSSVAKAAQLQQRVDSTGDLLPEHGNITASCILTCVCNIFFSMSMRFFSFRFFGKERNSSTFAALFLRFLRRSYISEIRTTWPPTLKSQELSLWEVKLSISIILHDTNQPITQRNSVPR